MIKDGLFIVIEGIDGSGKGTQSKLLYNWLTKEGYDVFLTREPSDGKIGRFLKESLSLNGFEPAVEALLFAADRKEHTTIIENEMVKGRVVVCDRYLLSSIAYQGAHGLDVDWIKSINKFAIEPDIILLLDLEPELAVKRVNSRGGKTDYFERLDFLRKVRKVYMDQSAGLIIDAEASVEEVHTDIKKIVSRHLKGLRRVQG